MRYTFPSEAVKLLWVGINIFLSYEIFNFLLASASSISETYVLFVSTAGLAYAGWKSQDTEYIF
jgi:hypothetical protein